jgi:hypothetical protein
MTRQCPTCGLSVTEGAWCPLCRTLLARPANLRKIRRVLICAVLVEEALVALVLHVRG